MDDHDPKKPKIIIEDSWSLTPKVRILRTELDERRENAIKALRALLQKAESGEVVELAILTFPAGDGYSMSWAGVTQANMLRFLGGLRLMSDIISHTAVVKPDRPPSGKRRTGGDGS
jgi:hypothetical protein